MVACSAWPYNDLLNNVLKHADGDDEALPSSSSSWLPVFDAEVNPSSDRSHHLVIVNSSSSSDQTNAQLPVYNQMSTGYSGPTLLDIEKALSVTTRRSSLGKKFSYSRISVLDKDLSKTENKYTLKIKSNGIGMSDDGYKWRKYGQKLIKNSPNPRSYYKCTNPRCGAKKQVERSINEPDTLIITYEGLHLHFAYPYFTSSQTQQENQPLKKAKKTLLQDHIEEVQKEVRPQTKEETKHLQEEILNSHTQQRLRPQGLLEDVVPLAIRKPSNESMFDISSCSTLYPSPMASSTSLNLSYLPLLWGL